MRRNQSGAIIGLIILIISISVFSCAEDEKPVLFEEDELIRLLSGDSTKSWIRMSVLNNNQSAELSECDLYSISRYYIGESDSLKYEIRSNPSFCKGDTSLVESGIFETVFDEVNNQNLILYYHDQDTLEKKVREITSMFLLFEYLEGDILVEERFEAIIPEN